MEQQHIDDLLKRYLGLLDEYTRLRQNLTTLQSGVYQNIARANFSGERGMRYGKDHFDERMQALRLLTIGEGERDAPVFTMSAPETERKPDSADADKEAGEKGEKEAEAEDPKSETPKAEEKKNAKLRNPLHWFGLFAPMPLRTAQHQSIQAVEDIIPRLVSVNAEMLNVEIEVRRARKRRAKAAGSKQTQDTEAKANTMETRTQTAPVEAT